MFNEINDIYGTGIRPDSEISDLESIIGATIGYLIFLGVPIFLIIWGIVS